MVAEIQWNFITDKYTIVDNLDLAIVAARFKEKIFLRELISIRGKLLEIKTYEEFKLIRDSLQKIKPEIQDKRLLEIITKILEQINLYLKSPLEIDKKVDVSETEVIE